MVDLTSEYMTGKLDETVDGLKAAFSDGFQWHDISIVIQSAIEFAENLKLLQYEGPDKKIVAIHLVSRVIDEVDTPWLPDWLVDPLLKAVVPSVIDLVVAASKGEVAVNEEPAAE